MAVAAWAVLVGLSVGGTAHAGHQAQGSLGRDWAVWALMVPAMMLPMVNPVVCRVAAGGLWARRGRTVAEVVVGYVLPWLGFGLVATVLVRAVAPRGVGTEVVAMVLVVAAVWHVAPPRRRLMARCGSVQPGALRGRRASVDAVRNGVVLGLRCVATCGPAMAAMLLSHSLVLMAGVTAVLWSERVRGPNPGERVAHPAQAVALLVVATATVVAAR